MDPVTIGVSMTIGMFTIKVMDWMLDKRKTNSNNANGNGQSGKTGCTSGDIQAIKNTSASIHTSVKTVEGIITKTDNEGRNLSYSPITLIAEIKCVCIKILKAVEESLIKVDHKQDTIEADIKNFIKVQNEMNERQKLILSKNEEIKKKLDDLMTQAESNNEMIRNLNKH